MKNIYNPVEWLSDNGSTFVFSDQSHFKHFFLFPPPNSFVIDELILENRAAQCKNGEGPKWKIPYPREEFSPLSSHRNAFNFLFSITKKKKDSLFSLLEFLISTLIYYSTGFFPFDGFFFRNLCLEVTWRHIDTLRVISPDKGVHCVLLSIFLSPSFSFILSGKKRATGKGIHHKVPGSMSTLEVEHLYEEYNSYFFKLNIQYWHILENIGKNCKGGILIF